jgi:hypothetical protein
MELAVATQPEEGEDKERDDKDENLRDETFDYIRKDCSCH